MIITEPTGRRWEMPLSTGRTYSIGRAKESDILLNDRRVSRKHAFITADAQSFTLIDGFVENGQLNRSVNHVFINGNMHLECVLADGDVMTIGESTLEFKAVAAFAEPIP